MITHLQYGLFLTFFVMLVLFFENSISSWATEYNITNPSITNTSSTLDSNDLNKNTNSTCYYTGTTILTGRKYVAKYCPNLLGQYEECRNLEPTCSLGQYSVELGAILNIIPTNVLSLISLGTNDVNLFWLNSILFTTLGIGVTIILVSIVRGTGA